MRASGAITGAAVALAFTGAILFVQGALAAEPAVIPADGVSDIGSFEAVPFGGAGTLLLKPDDKATVRKLEDKHIQEMRALEDRYERELRALRVRQYAEREQLLKALAKR